MGDLFGVLLAVCPRWPAAIPCTCGVGCGRAPRTGCRWGSRSSLRTVPTGGFCERPPGSAASGRAATSSRATITHSPGSRRSSAVSCSSLVMRSFSARTASVAGSGRGLGHAMARKLAARGADLVLMPFLDAAVSAHRFGPAPPLRRGRWQVRGPVRGELPARGPGFERRGVREPVRRGRGALADVGPERPAGHSDPAGAGRRCG